MRRPVCVAAVFTVAIATLPTPASAVELLVGGPITTISQAIAIAPPGAKIRIKAGVYPEQVIIRKRVTLSPLGDGDVVIEGDCTRLNGIRIVGPAASGTVIQGIGVRRTVGAGVEIVGRKTRGVTLRKLFVRTYNCAGQLGAAAAGISLRYSGNGSQILDNKIKYRTRGPVWGDGDGIWIGISTNPSGTGETLVSGNQISGGRNGIGGADHSDPRGGFGRNTRIGGNKIVGCAHSGVQATGSNRGLAIVGNSIIGCLVGLDVAPTTIGPLRLERNAVRSEREGSTCYKLGGDGVITLRGNSCGARRVAARP